MKGFRTHFPILFLLAAALLRAQTTPQRSPEITAGEIAGHINYLASDALEGRGTGTKGGDAAAAYIRKEFKSYGLKPGGEKRDYFQTFEAVTGLALGRKNSLAIAVKGASRALTLKKDFIPLGFSGDGTASGPVVFAGYGITAAKLNYNDYENLDVRNRIALIFSGYPGDDDPHSEFATFGSLRNKALYAREAGAAALLVVRPDTSAHELYELKYDSSPTTAGIPILNISREAADLMFAAGGRSVAALYAELAAAKKPVSFPLPDCTATLAAGVVMVKHKTSNVVGILPGADPQLRDQVIVVGAHYDHLGWGQDGSLYRGKDRQIHHGADDNASGTSAVLELAQYFASRPERPKHTIAFMAFTGEEMGLLGSKRVVEAPLIPLDRIDEMLNLDMVGRMPDSTRELNVQGVGTSPAWKEIVEKANGPYAFKLKMIDDGQGPSDQSSFYQKNIPVLFFFTGLHSDYHKPSDVASKINARNEQQVASMVADIVRALDGRGEKLAFTKVKVKEEDRRARAFNVYVGTIPDYGSSEKGFRISGTSDGSPAAKAGLQAGDIIVKFGATDIQSIYDYMTALGMHKPGEDVPVTVKRGNETRVLTVHLEKK